MQKVRDEEKYLTRNLLKKLLVTNFQRELLNMVKYTGAKRALDSGCGEGFLLSFLDNNIKDWTIEGFDIDADSVKLAGEKNPGKKIEVRSIYDCGYPDESFDLVISAEVLEHLEDPRAALT